MENTTPKFAINLRLNSFVETFINEFTGLPGIKLEVVSPEYFKLVDTTCTTKSICKVIRIIKVPQGDISIWEFSVKHYNDESFSAIYNVNELQHASDVQYKANTILFGLLKSLYGQSNAFDKKHEAFEYFQPTIPYINVGVTFGLLLCGQRRLETDIHYHFEGNLIIFKTSLVADSLLKEIETLKKEKETLITSLKDVAYYKDHYFDESKSGEIVEKECAAPIGALKDYGPKPQPSIDLSEFGKLLAECIKDETSETNNEG